MEIKNWKEYPKVQEVKEKFENEKVRSSMRWVFQIMVTLVFAAVVAIMMFQTVTMQESSMEPTISVGDRFFINRAVYKFSSPQRGDMIVFRTSASDDAALHIRRVIGLPGETVQITGGRILINGEVYNEGKDFPIQALLQLRLRLNLENTLSSEITETTVRTVVMQTSVWSARDIL